MVACRPDRNKVERYSLVEWLNSSLIDGWIVYKYLGRVFDCSSFSAGASVGQQEF